MLGRVIMYLGLCLTCASADLPPQNPVNKPPGNDRRASSKQNPGRQLTPAEELQKSISDAGSDRTALVRNLKAYLEKFPDAPERPQIYRALVEACIQFKDDSCAMDYAERIVALTPDDTSMTLLTVHLLERSGDQVALRRAVTYVTRVNDSVKSTPASEKSPRVSLEEWERQKKRDQAALLALRGSLEERLKDTSAARRDFEDSYILEPNASAALELGELEELAKNYEAAARQYARAFALSDPLKTIANRHDIRQKLGNAWRLAHGSEAGLGDFLLKTIDEVSATTGSSQRAKRNDGLKDPLAFKLRKAPDGTPYPMSAQKGKVLVVNFWATWCEPCHVLQPIYEKLAAHYATNPDIVFLSANCDEDESLVAPYLADKHSRSTEVFADRLDELFAVESFPTVLILDASGKLAYRANGFDPDTIERELGTAIDHVSPASSFGFGKSVNGLGTIGWPN